MVTAAARTAPKARSDAILTDRATMAAIPIAVMAEEGQREAPQDQHLALPAVHQAANPAAHVDP